MGDVLVRLAAEGDLDTLLELYRDLAGAEASALPGDRAEAAGVLAEILTDRSRHLVVAERDGEVLGTADLLVVANLTHEGRPWAIIENVIVARDARRTGVGAAIFAHLIELARDAGCCKLELLSGKHRGEAHAFYRSVGFEAVAEGFKLYFDR
jgi:GNAT superfamily N-acetyltransferase